MSKILNKLLNISKSSFNFKLKYSFAIVFNKINEEIKLRNVGFD